MNATVYTIRAADAYRAADAERAELLRSSYGRRRRSARLAADMHRAAVSEHMAAVALIALAAADGDIDLDTLRDCAQWPSDAIPTADCLARHILDGECRSLPQCAGFTPTGRSTWPCRCDGAQVGETCARCGGVGV